MVKLKVLALGLGLLAASTLSAFAAQITGSINLTGDFQPLNAMGNPTQNLNQARGIDFLPLGGGTGGFTVGVATDDFAVFSGQSGGTIKDFTFNPFSAVSGFYGITAGGQTLTFDLTTLSIENQNASFLTISGSGTLYLTGFDPTPGTFFFSGNSSSGASPRATFSFSTGSLAQPTPVPEPATLALFGAGLLGLAAVRRAQRPQA